LTRTKIRIAKLCTTTLQPACQAIEQSGIAMLCVHTLMDNCLNMMVFHPMEILLLV
jgi:hypothetical protein